MVQRLCAGITLSWKLHTCRVFISRFTISVTFLEDEYKLIKESIREMQKNAC